MRVLGIGVQTAPAIASGTPADFEACARAIQVSIEEAAAMAGTRHLVKSRDTAKDAALRSYNHRRNMVHYVCDNAAKV